MRHALADFEISGVATTIPFHRAVLGHGDFRDGAVHTRWVDQEFMPAMSALQAAAKSATEASPTQAAK